MKLRTHKRRGSGKLKTETSGANGCKKKQFFYNAKHQLVALLQSVDRKATLYSEYLYDALGRRIEKIVWHLDASLSGVETEKVLADLARQQGEVINHERYAWQGSTLVHVRKLINGGNQQLTAERYIYEPGTHVPLAMHDTELGILHFDVDHLGTPKGLFDSAGSRLWQAEHSVYGQIESERSFKLHPVTGEQVAPKLRFQGQYEDSESGLFYNLNRYYDAQIGRYTTQDPIGLLGGLNAYQYCPNPVEWVDPLGLSCKENMWNVFQKRSAGQFSSRAEAAAAWRDFKNRDFKSMAKRLDLSSPEGGAVFWSGNYPEAEKFALNLRSKVPGATTLELTPGGSIFNNWSFLDEFFVYDDWDSGLPTDGKRLWSAISEEYANRTSGDVNVVQAYEGAIWKDYEKPALMSNDKVGDIFGHSVDAAK